MAAITDRNASPFDTGPQHSSEMSLDRPGLSGPVELSVCDRLGLSGGRPMTAAWVSDSLLARTIDVWSKAYGRRMTTQEAMEILMNIKRLGELLLRAREDDKK